MSYAPPIDSFNYDQIAERSQFMRRVYGHLAMALLVFVALEAYLLSIPAVQEMAMSVARRGGMVWLGVLLAFMAVTHIAQRMAAAGTSRGTQYAGLGLYVVAEAIIFLPLIGIVLARGETELLSKAGFITGGLFLGLSTVALTTERDLSFMQRFIKIGLWVALGIIAASLFFGFTLGIIFTSAMILLMAGCILYQTQSLYRTCPGNMYVAAALMLFASFMTLLWYVIRLLLSMSSNR